jgi:diphosphomevalonate decarboxylase
MHSRKQFIETLLKRAGSSPASRGEAYAPANIALCKYWGKRDPELNLPVNSSLSISLGELGTRTVIRFAESEDRILLNGTRASTVFSARLSAYLDLFRPEGSHFLVETENTIPTAAGLASSASGFAALIQALDQLMGWNFNPRELSMLARIGSGSASRSIFNGFAVWHAGQRADGMDSYAEGFPGTWDELRIGILEVSGEQKKIGSTEGMIRTTQTSELYESWPKQAACDYDELRMAIAAKDFSLLGKTAENNALAMHATMMASWPPLCYWEPGSVAFMKEVWKAREEGIDVYFTMDAGPNLKLLYLKSDQNAIDRLFPEMQVVNPFG